MHRCLLQYTTERSSPPVKFNITDIDVTLFQLIWGSPSNPNGSIDYYIVSSNNYIVSYVLMNCILGIL